MPKKIAGFFRANYFDPALPLEYRIYMIFFLESFFISILSAATNTMLGKGIGGIIFQWSYIALCVVVLFIPHALRERLSKPLLIFMTYIYIPFLYFETGGYNGTALMFSLLGIFLLAIVFDGRRRIWIIALDIAIYVVCCLMQYRNPALVTPHGSEQAKLVDFLVALVLSCSGLAVLTIYISKAYTAERARISNLLLEVEKKNDSLAEMTNRDPLTGVYNRRYLAEFFEKEQDICARTGSKICVMMLDLDYFKQVNDSYGHGFGDEVLIAFTKAVQGSLRRYDLLARLGGEEFAVVLHNIALEEAREIAERIREAVQAMVFRNNLRVTVSIGLVQSFAGETMDSILRRADQCLYAAKEQGRDRIVAQGDEAK